MNITIECNKKESGTMCMNSFYSFIWAFYLLVRNMYVVKQDLRGAIIVVLRWGGVIHYTELFGADFYLIRCGGFWFPRFYIIYICHICQAYLLDDFLLNYYVFCKKTYMHLLILHLSIYYVQYFLSIVPMYVNKRLIVYILFILDTSVIFNNSVLMSK